MLLAALVASHAGGSPSISGKGRAERCYVEAGQLFVNMTYPAINEMKVPLEAEYVDQNDPELLRTLALQSAEKTVILLVSRTVDYALAKQLNKEVGSEGARNGFVGRKLKSGADDYTDARQNVRRAIGKILRMNREGAPVETVAFTSGCIPKTRRTPFANQGGQSLWPPLLRRVVTDAQCEQWLRACLEPP